MTQYLDPSYTEVLVTYLDDTTISYRIGPDQNYRTWKMRNGPWGLEEVVLWRTDDLGRVHIALSTVRNVEIVYPEANKPKEPIDYSFQRCRHCAAVARDLGWDDKQLAAYHAKYCDLKETHERAVADQDHAPSEEALPPGGSLGDGPADDRCSVCDRAGVLLWANENSRASFHAAHVQRERDDAERARAVADATVGYNVAGFPIPAPCSSPRTPDHDWQPASLVPYYKVSRYAVGTFDLCEGCGVLRVRR